MDPVGFDKDGNMFVKGPTETPQWAPGVVKDPAKDGDSGSIPLTVNKLRAMNQQGSFSSQRTGRDAAYAVDNSNGTWWEPAEDDQQPTLTIDLGPATEFDHQQLFTIDSCRIEFTTGGGGFGRGMGRGMGRGGFGVGNRRGTDTTRAAQQPQQSENTTIAHRYKIEASTDGTNYKTVLDKTDNNVTKYVEFDEIPPTSCRFVRVTMTDWPRTGNSNLGIMEFTVFGKPIEVEKP